MSKIIACVNEKGGVAKTTTIKNLSIGLAARGKKVLAIDLDPSANLSSSLGILPGENDTTILDILSLAMEGEDIPEGMGIIHQDEGIDFIAAKKTLHDFENNMICAVQREIILRRYLETVRDKYDYIFIDCPAGLGIYVVNALFSADSVIIPVQPQFLGAGAMQNILGYINKVRRLNGTNAKPEISGILFTMVRVITNNDNEVMDFYKEQYSERIKIYDTYIPNSVKFSESDGEGKSIFEFAPKTTAAKVYNDLIEEFITCEEK